jgi:AcrR family transcriptional regulator
MSSVGDNASAGERLATKERRPHDATASRAALLSAARDAFRELGYERATTRLIGERAGVDPALIARYFGSKEGLFMAALAEMEGAEVDVPRGPSAFVAYMLEYWEERGHSPVSRALTSTGLTDVMRTRVSTLVDELLIKGEVADMRARGVAEAKLHAELLVALAAGVAIARANGTLETLAASSLEEVLAAIGPLVDGIGRERA